MAEQFVNYSPLAPIELSANVSSGATALALTGAGIGSLPSSGTYRFLIDGEEIVEVTAYSGGTATVVRGTEGTSAVAHNAGASVIPILTKAAMAQFATDVGGGGFWDDTLTGPSASGSYVFDIPPGTTMLRIKATASITVAGGSDTVGDAFATETTAAWTNVSSVVTQLTADRGEPFEFFNPAGNMAGTSFGVNTSGTQAYVSYGTNGTIDPGTSVDFQIWVEGVYQ